MIYIVVLNLFKGIIFTIPVFYSNMENGFSGIPIYDDFYYSLFNVLLSTITVTAYIWMDQSVSFNHEQYSSTSKLVKRNPDYDPV